MSPRYQYLHTPAQLAHLCRCLDETRHVAGCILEVGCYRGETTLFLNYHMTSQGIDKPYFAIDTFSGFSGATLGRDVPHSRDRAALGARFGLNDRRWFDDAMRRNSWITRGRVESIAAEAGSFDFATLAPIAFCLMDVVLYEPTRLALEHMWDLLSPGGIIVVDSIDPSLHEADCYSGSRRAYREFVDLLGLEPRFECQEYGILTKQAEGH
jgi:SAM-dependent methyltransferase